MSFEECVADLKAKAEAAIAALEAFNQRHPDLASDEAAALNAGVSALASTAKGIADNVAPPALQPSIDDVIAAIEAKAELDVAAITAAKDAHVAALQSVKAAVAA